MRFHLRNYLNLLPINNRVGEWEIKLEPPYRAPFLGLNFTPTSSLFSPWAAQGEWELGLQSIHGSFSLPLLPSHTLPLLQHESLAQKAIPHKLVFLLVWTASLLQLLHNIFSHFLKYLPRGATHTDDGLRFGQCHFHFGSWLKLALPNVEPDPGFSKEAMCLLKRIQHRRLSAATETFPGKPNTHNKGKCDLQWFAWLLFCFILCRKTINTFQKDRWYSKSSSSL